MPAETPKMHKKKKKVAKVKADMSCTSNAVLAEESNNLTLRVPEYFLRYIKRQSEQN